LERFKNARQSPPNLKKAAKTMFRAKSSFASRATILVTAAAATIAISTTLPARAEAVKYADQGKEWPALRQPFYTEDQGSRLIPLAWIEALELPDGKKFMADGLARYGYLPNENSDLPVGFVAANENGVKTLGMTCSACHTRQIEINGEPLRIDGGPGIVDMQGFWGDLHNAVGAVLATDAAFRKFADAVLGPSASDNARKILRQEVGDWYLPFDIMTSKSLPTPPWGPGRLDAVSQIFNRVAGLDIGTSPTHIIENNIAMADAPVRYPFLWNAARQDFTQWPGFAKNGDDILGLARNVGEVYGVFGIFHPRKNPFLPMGMEYLDHSSLNMPGLMNLETWIKEIEPPKWPGKIDKDLAERGKAIFDKPEKEGGCGRSCHQETIVATRPCSTQKTWATPVQDVGTDARQAHVLERRAQTGVLEGQIILKPPFSKLGKEAPIIDILTVAVVESILRAPVHFQDLALYEPLLRDCQDIKHPPDVATFLDSKLMQEMPKKRLDDIMKMQGGLENLYNAPPAQPVAKFEARVLKGIWATAPYLHNGSVPTLWDLLKPPMKRAATFKVGPAYDLENVGLAKEQTKFGDYIYQTTAAGDCAPGKRDESGNSRCGHNYGTTLSDAEKKALLEYLKSL
jgi:hypothetical protein